MGTWLIASDLSIRSRTGVVVVVASKYCRINFRACINISFISDRSMILVDHTKCYICLDGYQLYGTSAMLAEAIGPTTIAFQTISRPCMLGIAGLAALYVMSVLNSEIVGALNSI